MIGIVIPANNEEQHLAACLTAIQCSILKIKHSMIDVKVLVVLDACEDRSLDIVKTFDVDYIECQARCVGVARDLGVRQLIEQGADWIACTDADSLVASDWLQEQLLLQPVHAICGVVEIQHWQGLSQYAKQQYLEHYQDRMEHRHIHGANLSFSALAYLDANGFEGIHCHEDVRLIQRMQALNMNISWTNRVRVQTSGRLHGRVIGGFSHFLSNLEFNTIENSGMKTSDLE